jgi:hypothetical protein
VDAPPVSFGQWVLILAACTAATLVTPYHLHLYRALIEIIVQGGPFRYVSELTAPGFRALEDWFTLAATLGAVFALGWWRATRPFPLLLLAAGTFFSFPFARIETPGL